MGGPGVTPTARLGSQRKTVNSPRGSKNTLDFWPPIPVWLQHFHIQLVRDRLMFIFKSFRPSSYASLRVGALPFISPLQLQNLIRESSDRPLQALQIISG